MNNKYKFGDRLKELRISKGLTMDELSEKLFDWSTKNEIDPDKFIRINKSMISRWENNLATPDSKHISIYAKYFNVDINYLFGLTNVKNNLSDILKEKESINIENQISTILTLLRNLNIEDLKKLEELISIIVEENKIEKIGFIKELLK